MRHQALPGGQITALLVNVLWDLQAAGLENHLLWFAPLPVLWHQAHLVASPVCLETCKHPAGQKAEPVPSWVTV